MKNNNHRKFKIGQTIIIGKCASYEYYYDDLTKDCLCHDWRMHTCKCCGNIFKMLACPYYEKPIKGKFKVKIKKEDLKTYNDEVENLINQSKDLESAERKMYEILKRKYEGS